MTVSANRAFWEFERFSASMIRREGRFFVLPRLSWRALDLDPSGFLGSKVPELLVGKNNKLVLLDFVTFHDLVRRNLFACGISDPLKADSGEILLVG
jgi:hypothetical protein